MKNDFIYSTTDIIKNPMDKNFYKFVVLKNKLKVLIISDEKSDKSGCSLCVNVGSFDEPDEVNGLAHFLEHLLFMGTEKFPDENDYMNYLNMHNGNSNAYTCNDSTVYYFDISNKYFEGALDRFAQFFIAPLFKKDSVEREISAVHSEFLGNVSNDSSRRNRLLQLCYKDHLEEGRFNIGNVNTLSLENIREKVIDFYTELYVPDRMACVVYSNKPVEDIEKMIKTFENVPEKDSEKGSFIFDSPCVRYNEYIKGVMNNNKYNIFSQYKNDIKIFKSDFLNKILKLKSIEDTRRIDIYIKTLHPNISNVLFDVLLEDILKEDKGCIKILKDLNLVYDMDVYIRPVKYYGFLELSLFLTNEGFDNPHLVLSEVEKYFVNYEMSSDDIQRVIDHNEINFLYKEKYDVIDMIEEISDNIMRVPIKNILNFEYSQDLPSKENIESVIADLKNRNEWICIISSNEFEPSLSDGVFNIRFDK